MIRALIGSGAAQPRWQGDLLAAAAGGALPFAFAPFAIWPLAVLAPSALFLSWWRAGAARAAWRGWLFGVTSFGLGVSWIHESFRFSNIALPLAMVLTVGFVCFLALYLALAGWLLGCARSRVSAGWRLLALYPAGYLLVEWLRGWLLSGFTWLQLGYSQVGEPTVGWLPAPPLAALLPVLGAYGVGLAVAMLAGATAGLAALLLRAGDGAREAIDARAGWGALGVMLACASGAVASHGAGWTRPDGGALRVALVQGSVAQDKKWLPAMRVPTLERYLRLSDPHFGADLVVWPETALPGSRQSMAAFIAALDQRAREAGSAVLFGVPEFEGTPPRAFNSVLLIGTAAGRYRKRHLVPFGEFLPFETLLRPLTRALGITVSNFRAGAPAQPPLAIGSVELAVFICYEIAFGGEVASALPDARLLITVSNDAWFGDSLGPHQHLQIARARAMETGRYLLRATNTGITAIVDPRGALVASLPQFRPGAVAHAVQPLSGATPYVRYGDAPVLLLALACIFAAVLAGLGAPVRTRAR